MGLLLVDCRGFDGPASKLTLLRCDSMPVSVMFIDLRTDVETIGMSDMKCRVQRYSCEPEICVDCCFSFQPPSIKKSTRQRLCMLYPFDYLTRPVVAALLAAVVLSVSHWLGGAMGLFRSRLVVEGKVCHYAVRVLGHEYWIIPMKGNREWRADTHSTATSLVAPRDSDELLRSSWSSVERM